MAINRVPVFVNTPKTTAVKIDTADTSLTGPTNYGNVYANATGQAALISKIRIKALASTSAGMVRLFLFDGTNFHLWREVLVDAITAGATTKTFEYEEDVELELQTGWTLRATTHGGDDFTVAANVGEYLYAA